MSRFSNPEVLQHTLDATEELERHIRSIDEATGLSFHGPLYQALDALEKSVEELTRLSKER